MTAPFIKISLYTVYMCVHINKHCIINSSIYESKAYLKALLL